MVEIAVCLSRSMFHLRLKTVHSQDGFCAAMNELRQSNKMELRQYLADQVLPIVVRSSRFG